MATIHPTGMGNKTSRQFRRVVDDIMKYANSVYVYDEFNSVGNQWYDSHNTMRAGAVRHAVKPHVSASIIGRRDRRTTSR